METAANGQIDRIGNFAFEDNSFATATWVWRRYYGDKRFGIGVLGLG
jgi:hypothetical protein